MNCIFCGGKTSVENSRLQRKTNSKWRRRLCKNCSTLFSTIERADLSLSIVVRKQNNDLQPFVREKLLISIHDSLRHRKTAIDDATALTNTVVSIMLRDQNKSVIGSQDLVNTCLLVLKRFDKAAYTHYLAFHRH